MAVIEVRHPVDPVTFYPNNASLDFELGLVTSLEMSDANFGAYDRAKWAFSCWWKRESTGSASTQVFIGQSSGAGGTAFVIAFSNDNLLLQCTQDGTVVVGTQITTATYTDTASWHHLLWTYDSANAIAGDRIKLWVDGTEVTSFATDGNPTAAIFNSTGAMEIGELSTFGGLNMDGKMDEIAFFSGSLPAITDLITGTPGYPKDLTGLSGLFSWVSAKTNVVNDEVLGTDWTNINGVVRRTDDYP